MAASLLKGFDYEEAALLLLVLAGAAARAAGVRSPRGVLRHALLARPGSRRWSARSARRSGWGCSPSSTSTTRTSCGGSSSCRAKRRGSCAPRSARRSCCCCSAFARLIGYAPHEAPAPTDADLDDAGAAIARADVDVPVPRLSARQGAAVQRRREPAFVMYGVQGRTWVALGDPVGPDDRARASSSGASSSAATTSAACRCSTKSARRTCICYADFGLTFVKLGEEARVDLTAFTLEGGQARRGTARRFAGSRRTAAPFRIVDRRDVPRDHGAAARRVRRLARGKGERREGVLARLLRRGLPVAVSRSPSSSATAASRRSRTSGPGPQQRGAVDRSDALSPRRARRA